MSISLITAAALCVVFAVAAVGKVGSADSRAAFRAELTTFGVRSRPLKTFTSWAVPGAEFLIAITLISGGSLRSGALASAAGLLLAFSGAIVARASRMANWSGSCGCFGSGPALPLSMHVAQNGVLIAMAVVAIVVPKPLHSSFGDEILGFGGGVVLGALVVFAGTLHAVIRIHRFGADRTPYRAPADEGH